MTKPKPKAKAKRPKLDWPLIRAEFEAGGPTATDRALARKHGCSHAGIAKRRKREGWTQDVEPMVRRQMAEQLVGVSGVGAGRDNEKLATAVAEEAARRVAVITRHRGEWDAVRKVLYDGIRDQHQAAELAKGTRAKQSTSATVAKRGQDQIRAARSAALALGAIQLSERRAWGLTESEKPKEPGGLDDGDATLTVIWEGKPYDEDPDTDAD